MTILCLTWFHLPPPAPLPPPPYDVDEQRRINTSTLNSGGDRDLRLSEMMIDFVANVLMLLTVETKENTEIKSRSSYVQISMCVL